MFCTILFGKMILMNLFLGLISYTFDKTMEENRSNELGRKQTLDRQPLPQAASREESRRSALHGSDRALDGQSQRVVEGRGEQPPKSEVQMAGEEMGLKEEEGADQEANESRVGLLGRQEGRAGGGRGEPPVNGNNEQTNMIDSEDGDSKEHEPLKTVFVNLQKGGLRGFCAKILLSPIFSLIRIVFIVLNAVLFGLIKYHKF